LLAALIACGGCRFREPEPSEAVYRAAVAPAEKRPGINRTTPVAAPEVPAPTVAEPERAPDPTPDGVRSDGHTELVEAPGVDALCLPHKGSLAMVGSVVRALTDKADAVKAAADNDAGITLESTDGRSWTVCLVLKRPAQGSQRLAGGSVARLWHVGGYGRLYSRRDALEEWVGSQGRVLAPALPARLALYVDPETATSESQLRSSIELRLQ